ncbi:MAG: ACT domain-containing protein [Sciscionella sp.]
MKRLIVDATPESYTVARLDPEAELPEGLLRATGEVLVCVARTPKELSVVAPTALLPALDRSEPGWRLLTVRGPLEFTLTGIMASLSGSLAAAGVTLFALSTFDTDHILVREEDLDRAISALSEAGHEVFRHR